MLDLDPALLKACINSIVYDLYEYPTAMNPATLPFLLTLIAFVFMYVSAFATLVYRTNLLYYIGCYVLLPLRSTGTCIICGLILAVACTWEDGGGALKADIALPRRKYTHYHSGSRAHELLSLGYEWNPQIIVWLTKMIVWYPIGMYTVLR